MKRVVFCGSRDYIGFENVMREVSALDKDDLVIVGGADGPDDWAKKLATDRGLQVVICYPNWKHYGKAAGPIRNHRMLDLEPHWVAAFWDGKSKGTKSTIDEAKARDISVTIFPPALQAKEAK